MKGPVLIGKGPLCKEGAFIDKKGAARGREHGDLPCLVQDQPQLFRFTTEPLLRVCRIAQDTIWVRGRQL